MTFDIYFYVNMRS